MVINMITKNIPFINIGPGEFIKEELKARNWRQEDLAEILGISLKSVNKLIKNKQSVTIEMAKLLNKAFGQSPQYWINLDTNYRLRLQKEDQKVKNAEIKAEAYKYMPLKEVIKKGWINKINTIKDLTNEFKKFWNLQEIDFSALDNTILPNFRKSEAFSQFNNYFALTWFQMAQKCAKVYQVNKYKRDELEALANNLYSYTVSRNEVETFLTELNKAGIKFFVLSHLQKTYIDGASFFDNSNPVIVYTARHNRLDNFWFTIAHEIGHVLLHLKKPGDFFIDNMDELTTDNERAANRFAERILKTKMILEYFQSHKKYISRNRVINCAHELKIGPAIIIGVLQHYNILSRRNLNDFKTSILELVPKEFLTEKYLEKIRKIA